MYDQVTIINGRAKLTKDPNSRLDYWWDWTDWLAPLSDEIEAAQVLGDHGLTVETVEYDTKTVKAFISGGTVGAVAMATCRITTLAGRVEDRSIFLTIKEK